MEPEAKKQKLTPTEASLDDILSTETQGLLHDLKGSIGVHGATESQVGILAYVHNDEPIRGIIKHRFSDFLVYEVDLDGTVVRIKSLDGPKNAAGSSAKTGPPAKLDAPPQVVAAPTKDEDATNKENASEEGETLKEGVQDPPPGPKEIWTSEAKENLTLFFNEEEVSRFELFVKAGPPESKAEKRSFDTSPFESKEERTKFHQTVRETFKGELITQAKDQGICVEWKISGDKSQRQREQTRGAQGARENLPKCIRLTLQKTNKEMHDALGSFCRTMHIKPIEVGMAGTKDKRGVTVQHITLRRGKKHTIESVWATINKRGNKNQTAGRGVFTNGAWGTRFADIAYTDKMLSLGDLSGNRFKITIRDIRPEDVPRLSSAVAGLRSTGFINYYGLQRFGTAPIPTHAIGLALLRSDWSLAVRLILSPRAGEYEDVANARELYLKNDIAGALKAMPYRSVAERAVLESLSKEPNDPLRALMKIPKNLRMMYVHAWQSYVWNSMASERVRIGGSARVIPGDLVFVDVGGGEEAVKGGESDGKLAGEAPQIPNLPLEPSLAEDDESETLPSYMQSKIRQARPLTAEEAESGRYSLFDIVLPLPGHAVVYPDNELKEKYAELIRKDGLDVADLSRKQKEFSLGGTYRHLFHLPKDIHIDYLVYTSPEQDLALSDEEILRGRKIELKHFKAGETLGEKESIAFQVEWTLGTGTYATMALRELLKAPTDGGVQREMTSKMENCFNNALSV